MQISQKSSQPSWKIILAFTTVYIVWGSTYFFIQKAVHAFPPFLLGALRFLAAGILLLTWCAIRREPLFVWKDMKLAALTGVLLLFVGNGGVIWAEQWLPSALVAIFISAAPIWFVVLDKPKWKQNFSSKPTIAGLIMGFIGIVLLFGEKISSLSHSSDSKTVMAGIIVLVIGSISWAGGSINSSYKSKSGVGSVNTSWQMIAAGLAFIPGCLLLGEPATVNWSAIPADAWIAVVYLILFGSIAAYSAYVYLLKHRPPAQVSTYGYVNPVVAVLLGVFFANEQITVLQISGLAIILTSVLLINLAKYRQTKADQAAPEAEQVEIVSTKKEYIG